MRAFRVFASVFTIVFGVGVLWAYPHAMASVIALLLVIVMINEINEMRRANARR